MTTEDYVKRLQKLQNRLDMALELNAVLEQRLREIAARGQKILRHLDLIEGASRK